MRLQYALPHNPQQQKQTHTAPKPNMKNVSCEVVAAILYGDNTLQGQFAIAPWRCAGSVQALERY